MYGQYGQSGLFGGYDEGDSSHSESFSYPGASSKKKKRVPLLGTMRRTSQPVPILPYLTVLKDMAKHEEKVIAHADDGSDMSLMSVRSDFSSDMYDEATTTPGINRFSQDSNEMCMKNSESQLCSNLKAINMQEAEAPKQVQCFNYNQAWPKELETVVPDPRAVVRISEAYKTNGFVNNADKDVLLSQMKYPSAKSLSTNLEQERIVNNYNSIKSRDTFLHKNVITCEPLLEEVEHSHNSSELSAKKEGDEGCMRPPCSSVRKKKVVVFQDIINQKDILSLKAKSIDVKGATKIIQTNEGNLKEVDVNYVTNKENDAGLLASKTAALVITPARNSPLSDPQIPATKDVSMEKQLNETTVAAQKVEKMQQSKSSLGLRYKTSCKEHLNVASKPVHNYITVNGKCYKVQKILGRGGSSQVFEVLDPITSQELAMKCVNLSEADPSIAQGYLNEIELLKGLQGSERVITMSDYEYAAEKQMLYVVMEKGETDLSKLMKNISKTNQIPIMTIIYYWVEMLRAVKNTHANNVIHSDLKPANFLLVGGCLKLIDFGIASSVQSDMTSVVKDAQAGTFNYMSPEAIQCIQNGDQSGYKVSFKSDIWSLGCILYNLLYGKTPFQHIVQPWAKVAAITNPGHNIDYTKTRNDCPPVLLKAVQQCLTFDPKNRPTAADLLELPYVNYGPI